MPHKPHFVASDAPEAQATLTRLRARYGDAGAGADVIVALGGDGFMLQTLHGFVKCGVPIYGLNFGSIGFLMNELREDDLLSRIEAAKPARIHPLLMTAYTASGAEKALAFNEVSLFRQTRQAAKLRIVPKWFRCQNATANSTAKCPTSTRLPLRGSAKRSPHCRKASWRNCAPPTPMIRSARFFTQPRSKLGGLKIPRYFLHRAEKSQPAKS